MIKFKHISFLALLMAANSIYANASEAGSTQAVEIAECAISEQDKEELRTIVIAHILYYAQQGKKFVEIDVGNIIGSSAAWEYVKSAPANQGKLSQQIMRIVAEAIVGAGIKLELDEIQDGATGRVLYRSKK